MQGLKLHCSQRQSNCEPAFFFKYIFRPNVISVKCTCSNQPAAKENKVVVLLVVALKVMTIHCQTICSVFTVRPYTNDKQCSIQNYYRISLLRASFVPESVQCVLKSTKGVNQRERRHLSKQQRLELPAVTLTWHASKYEVPKLHQRYTSCCCFLLLLPPPPPPLLFLTMCSESHDKLTKQAVSWKGRVRDRPHAII